MADVDSGRLADWEQPVAAGYGVRAPREAWALPAVDQAEKGRGWLLPQHPKIGPRRLAIHQVGSLSSAVVTHQAGSESKVAASR